jgi:hypothetical protein
MVNQGSHAFEVLVTVRPNAPSRKLPGPDEIYEAAVRSVVWIQKLDGSFRVYDIRNRERMKSQESKLRVPVNGLSRSVFSFAPTQLEAGTYRIDVLVNADPVWRTYFRITN